MNSFNHYAYGAIGDWMYRVSAGIEIKNPGYKHIAIQPHPTKKLTYSKASFESSYGTIASGWERKGGKITVNVKIPANTVATITLPVNSATRIAENGKNISENKNFSDIRTTAGKLLFEAGSGNYVFEYTEE
jgi:alpha-L-rhamnosidase